MKKHLDIRKLETKYLAAILALLLIVVFFGIVLALAFSLVKEVNNFNQPVQSNTAQKRNRDL
jgi:fructose-specific phosphotransferase system IIC component